MTPGLVRLEFPALLSRVSTLAGSAAGRAAVLALLPAPDPDGSARLRDETLDAAFLLSSGTGFPAGAPDALGEAVEMLARGVICAEPSLLRRVGEALDALSTFLSAFGDARTRSGTGLAAMERLCASVPDLPAVSRHLLSITTPAGELSPDASPELKRLSRIVDKLTEHLHNEISRLASALEAEGVLRDIPPTVRNGRFVLPVLAARRSRVPGTVHDRSETGGTFFIEPQVLTESGNNLQEALLDHAQEQRRVLREATALLRSEQAALSAGAAAGASLDCAFARARYQAEEATVFPADGPLHLSGLRHPMIPQREVVANDFHMPPDWRVLVVSGPNAGGKSVLLKAVGLAVASAQSGLGAAAGAGSTMPHFESIRVSIGDQQSLVEKLSTYSARLAEELDMLTGAGSRTLVLLDEPAAGTDPLPGAALAAAILEALAESGARAVVTTHLGPLKTLASMHPGFYNGSMNFSEEHITPDYRFRFGIPGSSFALEIAGRMGFPERVLARAQDLAGDSFMLDRLIADLAGQVAAVAAERAALADATALAGRAKAGFEAALARHEAESARAAAEQEARMAAVIRDASSRADSLLARIRDGGPEERREARRGMRALSEELSPGSVNRSARGLPDSGSELSPGDGVSVPGWNGTGVIETVRSGMAVVRIGSISVEKPVAGLVRAEIEGRPERTAQWDMAPPSPEVDVRGMSSEEAVHELDLRIDACSAAGVSRLRIIHGKGRGILMKAVTDYLRRDRRVSSSAMAEPREGGTGVTIAILRSGGA